MAELIQAGTIVAFAGKAIPPGWEICDGREVNKTDPRYQALYRAIGITWGGNDNPNFRLPGLEGRFLMGSASTSVGKEGGSSNHDHGSWTDNAFEMSDGYRVTDDRRAPHASGLAHKHRITAVNHLPPYKQIMYIIKL
jgi:hypothetical protein